MPKPSQENPDVETRSVFLVAFLVAADVSSADGGGFRLLTSAPTGERERWRMRAARATTRTPPTHVGGYGNAPLCVLRASAVIPPPDVSGYRKWSVRVGEACRNGLRSKPSLRSWVKLVMDALEAVAVHVGVNLRCGNVGMTQHLLNHAEVGAIFQEVRGKTVAQHVRADMLGDAGAFGAAVHEFPQGHAAQLPAAVAQEHRARRVGPYQLRTHPVQIQFQPFQRLAADRDDAFLVALANHTQEAGLEVNVLQLQPGQFGCAQPAGIHDLEDRLVAHRTRVVTCRQLKQLIHVHHRERLGQRLEFSGAVNEFGHIGRHEAVGVKKAEEDADGGQFQQDRVKGHLAFALVEQVVGDVLRHNLAPAGHIVTLQVAGELRQHPTVSILRILGVPALQGHVGDEFVYERLHEKRRVVNEELRVSATLHFYSPLLTDQFCPGDPPVCLKILFARLGNDFRRQHRSRRRLVPVERFEVVAHELLVETGLAATGLEFARRPETRTVWRQHFVDENHLSVRQQSEFEFGVSDDDPALAGKGARPLVDGQ